MSSSPTYRELLLEWGLAIGSPTRPTNLFVGFHTGDPGTTGASESSGLARTQHDAWEVGTAGDGQVQNSGTGETAVTTAAETITHFSVWSAVSGGSYYFGGALDSSRVLTIGDKLGWANAALKASIT